MTYRREPADLIADAAAYAETAAGRAPTIIAKLAAYAGRAGMVFRTFELDAMRRDLGEASTAVVNGERLAAEIEGADAGSHLITTPSEAHRIRMLCSQACDGWRTVSPWR